MHARNENKGKKLEEKREFRGDFGTEKVSNVEKHNMHYVSEAEDTVDIDKERNVRALRLLTSMKVKKNFTDVVGVNNACREIKKIMNEWIEPGMATCIVNEKDKAMTKNQNWAFSARFIDINNKKVQFFMKLKTVVNCYYSKICVCEKCTTNEIWISQKNTKMKHVKNMNAGKGMSAIYFK